MKWFLSMEKRGVNNRLARYAFLNLYLDLSSGTSDQTGSSGSDETDLLTWNGRSSHGRCLSDVLVITSSVWVVHWVHGHTTSSWPAVSLDLEFVVGTSGLEHGFVDSTTSGNDSDHTSSSGWDNLLGSRWQLETGLASVEVVSDNDNVVS